MSAEAWFSLSAPEWAQLRALLDEGLALSAGERAAWLTTLSDRAPPAVLERLKATLALEEAAPARLDDGPSLRAADSPAPSRAGQRVGPYQVLRLLG